MSDEHDRVALLSDLRVLESGLVKRLTEVNAEIVSEGEKTRRHFDVVAERLESLVKLVAEVNSHHATVLDDHEHRLQNIEGQI
jgi:hypothetical protein